MSGAGLVKIEETMEDVISSWMARPIPLDVPRPGLSIHIAPVHAGGRYALRGWSSIHRYDPERAPGVFARYFCAAAVEDVLHGGPDWRKAAADRKRSGRFEVKGSWGSPAGVRDPDRAVMFSFLLVLPRGVSRLRLYSYAHRTIRDEEAALYDRACRLYVDPAAARREDAQREAQRQEDRNRSPRSLLDRMNERCREARTDAEAADVRLAWMAAAGMASDDA